NAIWGIIGGEILALQNPRVATFLLVLYAVYWAFAVWGLSRTGQAVAERQPSLTITVSVLVCSFLYSMIAMVAISLAKPILYPRYVLMSVSQGIVTHCSMASKSRATACFCPCSINHRLERCGSEKT